MDYNRILALSRSVKPEAQTPAARRQCQLEPVSDITPEQAERNFRARWGMSSDQWWDSYAIEIGAHVA